MPVQKGLMEAQVRGQGAWVWTTLSFTSCLLFDFKWPLPLWASAAHPHRRALVGMGSMAFAPTLCPNPLPYRCSRSAPRFDSSVSPARGTEHWGPVESQRVQWRGVRRPGPGALPQRSPAGQSCPFASWSPLSLQLILIQGRGLQPGLCHPALVTQVSWV